METLSSMRFTITQDLVCFGKKKWRLRYSSIMLMLSVLSRKLPESVLALPITLYLLPVTFFYHIELILSSIDNTLYHNIPTLYAAYSQMYGPFKEEWRGKIVAKEIVANQMPDARYDRIVFFSGGVDAIHAGINNPGKRNVLVSVPSIEVHSRNEGALRNEKFVMIKEFSRVIGSDWLLVANDFNQVVFDDEIGRKVKLRGTLGTLSS